MEFQSVKETAEKFNISERRVQKLCEEGRIIGAKRISNVWLIPKNAIKPSDKRIITSDANLVSLSELCKELSISIATGRNWLKLGKLISGETINGTAFFTKEYIKELKDDIQNGKNSSLKSRRNKKFISGNNLYNSYISDNSKNLSTIQKIVSYIEEKNIEVTEDILYAILAECAVQLTMEYCNQKSDTNSLIKFIHKQLPANKFEHLINDLISNNKNIETVINLYEELFNQKFVYEESEDILGLLYISLKNLGNRKATGSYYTPTKIVKRLCSNLFKMNNPDKKDVFDPCCGTGNFLLQLPKEISPEHVFGNDIDTVSVKIARLNYAMKYNICDTKIIYTHITEQDYLSFDNNRNFDFIIGNPPWGFEFTNSKKTELRKKYLSAKGSNIESYDVIIEQALSNLKKGGILSFVLPEAILNVKTHTPIRKILLNTCNFQYLEFLGNAFDKVQCPSIILQAVITNKAFNSIGLKICTKSGMYTIKTKRKVNSDCISFSMTDKEYNILEKMDNLENKAFLSGNAKFALGIVTGNNKAYISDKKNADNEMVLKGSDLNKFRYTPSSNYIKFKPKSFQQVAPTEYYRAKEKLFYRFICNQLVFSYDNKQTLSLNSCNILIPEIPNLEIKYILAVLNSRCAQFYFKKQFNSVKVLRSHIEQIPIPKIEKSEQRKIIELVDDIIKTSNNNIITDLYEKLDTLIANLYHINTEEYNIIKSSVSNDNLVF